jgi:hypothetical protein
MIDLKKRKEIVENLINSFNSLEKHHDNYKKFLEKIIATALFEFANDNWDNDDLSESEIYLWIHNFVEKKYLQLDKKP